MWHGRGSPRVNREKAQQKRSQPSQTPAHPPAPDQTLYLTGLELSHVESKGGTSCLQFHKSSCGRSSQWGPKLLVYMSYPSHCTTVSSFQLPLLFCSCFCTCVIAWPNLSGVLCWQQPRGHGWIPTRPQVLLQASCQYTR